ncbi:MAG: O-antigen ligase family protein, partial [Eubacteriales bacterium]
WFDREEVRPGIRKLLGAGVVVYALAVLVFYVVYTAQVSPSVAAQFAPSSALQRAGTMSNQDSSFIGRVDLTIASFKMAMDYPVNGLGGQGWDALYHRYMPYLMYSSETHNYPAKVLVETGFIGLLVLLGIWFVWGKAMFRLWWAGLDEDSWLLVWAGGIAALTLVIHSVIDFDLSMGAMGILLWTLWGIIRAAEKIYLKPDTAGSGVPRRMLATALAATVGGAVLFVPAASLYAATTAGADGAKAMTERNWNLAVEKLQKAARLDPFTASYAADLSQVYTVKGMGSGDKTMMAMAEEYARRAVESEPYNYQVRLRLMLVSLLTGRVERAVEDAESLVAHNPLDVNNFEILGKVYITSGRYLYESNRKDKARVYWQKALTLRGELDNKLQEISSNKNLWQGEALQVTPVVNLYEGEAAYLLGDYNKAGGLLQAAGNAQSLSEPLRVEALLYLNAAKAKLGRKTEAELEIARLAKEFPGLPLEFQRVLKILP